MSAYLVFIRERTLDAGELEIYWSKIRATFAGHDVKVLASYVPKSSAERLISYALKGVAQK